MQLVCGLTATLPTPPVEPIYTWTLYYVSIVTIDTPLSSLWLSCQLHGRVISRSFVGDLTFVTMCQASMVLPRYSPSVGRQGTVFLLSRFTHTDAFPTLSGRHPVAATSQDS